MSDKLMYNYHDIPDYAFGIAEPNFVMRSDQTIVKWQDVPEIYQKRIMEGTMTTEDWDADWGVSLVAENHICSFRKEYPKCVKGCGRVRIS